MARQLTGFVNNTVLAFFAKVFPILISIGYTFFIAKVLGPEVYGEFLFVLAFIANLFLLFGAGSLNELLLVFYQKTPSKKFLLAVLGIEFAVAILLFAGFLIFGPSLSFFETVSSDLLFWATFLILLLPFNTLALSFYKSTKQFGKLLKVSLLENGLNLLLALVAIFVFNLGVIGILLVKLFSIIVSALYSVSVFLRHDSPWSNKLPVPEMKKFMKWNFPHDLVRVLIHQARLIFVGLFISPIALGFYYFGQKICDFAFGTFNASISDVIFVYANQASKDLKKLGKYLSIAIRVSFYINIVVLIGLILLAPFFLDFLFPQYSGAYPILLLWGISYLTGPIAQVTHAFKVINRMDKAFALILVALAANIISLWFLAPLFNEFGIVMSLIITNFINFALYIPVLKTENIHINLIPQKEDLQILKDAKNNFLAKIKR